MEKITGNESVNVIVHPVTCSYCGYLEPAHEERCLNQVTELDLKKLYDVIYNCQQVMAGYSQDDTWSDYDREVHAALIQMQFTVLRQLDPPPTNE